MTSLHWLVGICGIPISAGAGHSFIFSLSAIVTQKRASFNVYGRPSLLKPEVRNWLLLNGCLEKKFGASSKVAIQRERAKRKETKTKYVHYVRLP